MRPINWKKFILSEFPEAKLINGTNGEEANINCISHDCPNPKMHMFINLKSKNDKHDRKFVCHRCGISGNHKAFLMEYYNASYNQIMNNLSELYGDEGDIFKELKNKLSNIRGNLVLEQDELDDDVIIDLPKESKRITHQTKYLVNRMISNDIVAKFKIRLCDTGFYRNRLIIPIITNNNRSFLAYSQSNKKALMKYKRLHRKDPYDKLFENKSKKILYPLRSVTSIMLLNYNNVKKNKKIILVEGFMDCARVTMHGYNSLAYLGGYISSSQAMLIAMKEPKEVLYMPDSDLSKEQRLKAINTLNEYCECKVRHIRLSSGDPDDIKSKRNFVKLIKTKNKKLIEPLSLLK